ncbi:DUF488 domain-containing protein [Fodinibius salsisoli]|uniref:DUF488 domain-containing protein n=1 Tax=Fodinibius salsisoli TaxID=2820877 RepID=A0ABT3PQG4_9BACT|nr:DUF488 domain-containing protein [Fodinibius salsisoli]MCW9708100.1 DUF488 domain-containing protein [Fodinibius salsisoli]
MIQLKRAYDTPDPTDGYRILVDRLWPRGVSKEQLKLDLWLKEIAPSDELRRWFQHDPEKFEAFSQRYRQELEHNEELVQHLLTHIKEQERTTFVFAAKDRQHNNAVVLKAFVEEIVN